ncbi:MAG: RHS repeat-associated core domain-containing protein [Limisphaerales bacterium]
MPLGSRVFQKKQYDGVNRPTVGYLCYSLSEADTNYTAASSVTANTVLNQREMTYDDASNLILLVNRDRFHNATGLGPLTTPGGAQPQARASYRAIYPDPLGRIQSLANYGTNGGAVFTRPPIVPASSPTVLVSAIAYNDRGEPYQMTDAAGTVTQQVFDDAGRRTQLIENYVSGGADPDQNRTTNYTYNADSRLATLTAVNSVTGSQTTTWVYGTTLSDSGVASNDLVSAKQLPDNVSGSDQVTYAYNRLGQVTEIQDQNGTTRTLDYDVLGRLQDDRVTTLSSGVDGTILRISRTYEVRGMLTGLTSYNNATVGSGSVVNDIQYRYNGFAQLATESQSHDGPVTDSSPVLQYVYANGSSGYARRTAMIQPDGTLTSYAYGASGSATDVLNQISGISSLTGNALYAFLGANQPVIASYGYVRLTYYTAGGSGDAGDQYTGLDRFGRIVDQRWTNEGGIDIERVQYGYDQANNRVWRHNTVAATGQDEFYAQDGLYQLETLQRGTLNSGKTGISGTPSWEEDWNFDPSGNWNGTSSGYQTKVSGTTTLNQNRTHSVVNEISGITTSSGTAWTTPAYDDAGNTTSAPQPFSPSNRNLFEFDAWNRLVKVVAADNSVYAYDGANRRVSKLIGTEIRDYYYDDRWRVVEERLDSSSMADRRFLWGIRRLDDLIERDVEVSSGGGGSDSSSSSAGPTLEQFFALDDGANITAIANVTGQVQERYGYNGFGGVRYMTASFGNQGESNYDWETLFGSYRFDTETGLSQVRFRYYHSLLGRWISRDPVGEKVGPNLYKYVGNRPTIMVDPLGLFGSDPYYLPPSNGSQINAPPALNMQYDPCTGQSTVSNNDSPEELALMMMAGLGLSGIAALAFAGPPTAAAAVAAAPTAGELAVTTLVGIGIAAFITEAFFPEADSQPHTPEDPDQPKPDPNNFRPVNPVPAPPSRPTRGGGGGYEPFEIP